MPSIFTTALDPQGIVEFDLSARSGTPHEPDDTDTTLHIYSPQECIVSLDVLSGNKESRSFCNSSLPLKTVLLKSNKKPPVSFWEVWCLRFFVFLTQQTSRLCGRV